MKKIISTIFFIFFATSVFSAEPLVDVSWLNKNLNNKPKQNSIKIIYDKLETIQNFK